MRQLACVLPKKNLMPRKKLKLMKKLVWRNSQPLTKPIASSTKLKKLSAKRLSMRRKRGLRKRPRSMRKKCRLSSLSSKDSSLRRPNVLKLSVMLKSYVFVVNN